MIAIPVEIFVSLLILTSYPMTNSKGANAVEVDITFNHLGVPIYTYHGPPCDCWRHCHQQEDFNEYLSYVHDIAIAEPEGIGENLTLLFLDLKLDYLDPVSKARAGIELANSIMNYLYPKIDERTLKSAHGNTNRSKLSLVLSVNHVTDVELVNNFINHLDVNNSSHLMQRIGFDVGMNDEIQHIEAMWKRFGNSLNIWQGDGFTNCFSPFYNLERLSKAIVKRDNEKGYPKKVYQWTIDLHDRIREALRMGVDAVMTNHPERVLSILSEPELVHNVRLATRDDDPFKKLVTRGVSRSGETARFQRSVSSISGGFIGSLLDVIASWVAYLKEIPFLSLPTTTRLMQKRRRTSLRRTLDATPQTTTTTSPSNLFIRLQPRVDSLTLTTKEFIEARSSSGASPTTTESSLNVTGSTTEMTATTLISNSTLISSTEKQTVAEDGPKWYVSLTSNFLVSMLKLFLPVNGTSTSTTTTTTTTTVSSS